MTDTIFGKIFFEKCFEFYPQFSPSDRMISQWSTWFGSFFGSSHIVHLYKQFLQLLRGTSVHTDVPFHGRCWTQPVCDFVSRICQTWFEINHHFVSSKTRLAVIDNHILVRESLTEVDDSYRDHKRRTTFNQVIAFFVCLFFVFFFFLRFIRCLTIVGPHLVNNNLISGRKIGFLDIEQSAVT